MATKRKKVEVVPAFGQFVSTEPEKDATKDFGGKSCPQEQVSQIKTSRRFSAIFLVMMVAVPATILPLMYFTMVDGIVRVRVSGTFDFPAYTAFGVNYSVGACQIIAHDDERPWISWYTCRLVRTDLTFPANSSNLFKITGVRACFSKFSSTFSATELMKAFIYYGDSVQELSDYFAYNGIFCRDIAVSTELSLSELQSIDATIRVPRDTYLMSVWINVAAKNYTNPYGNAYFKTSFIAFLGKESNTNVGFDKITINVTGSNYNDSAYNDWKTFASSNPHNPRLITPSYYPWNLGVEIIRDPNNPEMWNPFFR